MVPSVVENQSEQLIGIEKTIIECDRESYNTIKAAFFLITFLI